MVGPFSNVRNVSFGAVNSPNPPGKYGLPVRLASTSAPARLKVLCPEMNAGNAGVTNVRRWYVIQSTARTHPTPETWLARSPGSPSQSRTAIWPTKNARCSCRCPGALLSLVMTSMSPGTSGSPCGSYEGPFGSDDCYFDGIH